MLESRGTRRVLALLALAALLMAACSSDDSDAGASDDTGGAREPAADSDDSDAAADDSDFDAVEGDFEVAQAQDAAEDVDETNADTPESALAAPTALTGRDIGRDIVFRATIGVEVADVDAAGREAAQIVQSLGGIVFGQTTTVDPSPRSVLTFKILPEDFDDALDQLAGVGELVDQTISADDVTDRVVDLQSRITTSEASVLRLRGFLETAASIDIIADLERQLLDRETTLETLRGQLRTLRDQVSLATITLTITEKGIETLAAELAVEGLLGKDEAAACPGSVELDVSRDGSAVWCIEVENTGDATLLDVELESEALRLRMADFTVRIGEPAEMAPGDRLIAIVELDLEDGRVRRRDARGALFLDVTATATPADNPDAEVRGRSEAVLFADADDPLPGFFDAFSGALGTLAVIGSIGLIALGAVLPFAPFILIAAYFIRRQRQRNRARSAPIASPPPPPPPTSSGQPAETAGSIDQDEK